MNYRVTLVESDEGFAIWCDDLPGYNSQGETARRRWQISKTRYPSIWLLSPKSKSILASRFSAPK